MLRHAVLQAARNADFFVINRQDFLSNTAIDIWPGQKVTIASGKDQAAQSAAQSGRTIRPHPVGLAHGLYHMPIFLPSKLLYSIGGASEESNTARQ